MTEEKFNKWRHKETNLVLYSDSLATLNDSQWIDDVILELEFRNIYASLRPALQRKIYFFPVLFGNKLDRSKGEYNEAISWVKDGRIFSREYLFMCQHVNGNHWRLLVICFPSLDPLDAKKQGRARPCILAMDSLLRCCDDDTTLSHIRGFLSAAWEQSHKTARNFSSLPVISVAVPQQIGITECGTFVILFAKHLLEDLPIDLSRNEIDKSHWFTVEDAKMARRELRERILKSCELCGVESNEKNISDEIAIRKVKVRKTDRREVKRGEKGGNKLKSKWNVDQKAEGNDQEQNTEDEKVKQETARSSREGLGPDLEKKTVCKTNEKEEKTGDVACDKQENVMELLEAIVKGESFKDSVKEEEIPEQDERKWEQTQEKEEVKREGTVYKVLGRLTVTGKHYFVDEAEIKRRVKGENMSANVFRSLIRVGKRDLPREVLAQPKKAKTQVSIFSALTEGEAQDLALGYGSSLTKNISKDRLLMGISADDAQVTVKTIQTIRRNLNELGPDSDFAIKTHNFGPVATDLCLSFVEDQLK